MSKPIHIYYIARGYKKVTVWIGSRMTQSRMCQDECVPNKSLSHRERRDVVAAFLYKNYGIPGPVYQETE